MKKEDIMGTHGVIAAKVRGHPHKAQVEVETTIRAKVDTMLDCAAA